MTTASDIIDEASDLLHGDGSTADRVTPLNNTMTPTDTSFTVDFAYGQSVGISPGVIEVDSELMYAVSVDATSNTITLADGFGRGYKGTAAVAHTIGARVVSRPRFPRTRLFRRLNEVVAGVFPQLFAVATKTDTVITPSDSYTLTGTPMDVLDCQWQDLNGDWQKVNAYSVDPYDKKLRIGDDLLGAMVGQPLRTIYSVRPTPFVNESDDFSVTGLPASCVDLLVLGVVARTVPGLDISRAQNSSVEQSTRGTTVPPNAGLTSSSYLMKMFAERLAQESSALRKQFSPRLVRVR